MGSTTPTSELRCGRDGERGFTLAGLIVLLTIIAVFIAYTVPTQWSKVMQREREKQTIFAMRQYTRAIYEFNRKNNALPVSIDQLKEARLPRLIRGPKGELIDPLTGEVDWILIPPGAVTGGQLNAPGTGGIGVGGNRNVPSTTSGTAAPGAPGSSPTLNLQASPKDYKGPFVGVRPPVTGKAILTFRDSDSYEQWFYTLQDLQQEIQLATQPNANTR